MDNHTFIGVVTVLGFLPFAILFAPIIVTLVIFGGVYLVITEGYKMLFHSSPISDH